jgi:hypothetical protein
VKRTILFLSLFLLAACGGSYYRVKDTSSGRIYYTRDVDTKRQTGSVDFKDAKTGAKVTLQSSEVAKITESEYQKGLAAK